MFTALPRPFPLAKFAIDCTDPPEDIISHCDKDNCQQSAQWSHLQLLLTKLHKIAAIDICIEIQKVVDPLLWNSASFYLPDTSNSNRNN